MDASIELIMASILKYASITLQATSFGQNHPTLLSWLVLPFGCISAGLFLLALLDAHTGLLVCRNVLWPRMTTYEDHRRLF